MSQALPDPASALPNRPSPASGMAPGLQASKPRTSCVDSTEILRGQKTVEINHNGSTYRLQATRLGKLILTK